MVSKCIVDQVSRIITWYCCMVNDAGAFRANRSEKNNEQIVYLNYIKIILFRVFGRRGRNRDHRGRE